MIEAEQYIETEGECHERVCCFMYFLISILRRFIFKSLTHSFNLNTLTR